MDDVVTGHSQPCEEVSVLAGVVVYNSRQAPSRPSIDRGYQVDVCRIGAVFCLTGAIGDIDGPVWSAVHRAEHRTPPSETARDTITSDVGQPGNQTRV